VTLFRSLRPLHCSCACWTYQQRVNQVSWRCTFFSLLASVFFSLPSLCLFVSLSYPWTMSVFVDEIYIICGVLCCRNLILDFQKNLWEGRGFLFRWCLDEGPVCVCFLCLL
jgi:hypothetical protein